MDDKRVVFEFDRYVDGKLRAEGVKITGQPDLAGAMREAVRLAMVDARGCTVLVLRADDALTTAQARIKELEQQAVETALKAPPGHGSPCASCGEEIDAIAGNPSKWPTWIFADGAPQYYHVGCLAKRIAALEAGRHADRVAGVRKGFTDATKVIFPTLRNYELSNMMFDDMESFYRLTDLMTRDGLSIDDGIEQIQRMSDEASDAILAIDADAAAREISND